MPAARPQGVRRHLGEARLECPRSKVYEEWRGCHAPGERQQVTSPSSESERTGYEPFERERDEEGGGVAATHLPAGLNFR